MLSSLDGSGGVRHLSSLRELADWRQAQSRCRCARAHQARAEAILRFTEAGCVTSSSFPFNFWQYHSRHRTGSDTNLAWMLPVERWRRQLPFRCLTDAVCEATHCVRFTSLRTSHTWPLLSRFGGLFRTGDVPCLAAAHLLLDAPALKGLSASDL